MLALGTAGRRNAARGRQETVEFKPLIEIAAEFLDAAGVVVIVVGAVISAAAAAVRYVRDRDPETYPRFRRQLGRSILLGLELLVGADIVRTVAVVPSFDSVIVLALIVLIRTFLSFSLELEITGRWPWQKRSEASPAAAEA